MTEFAAKTNPPRSLRLVLHPATDAEYVHFQARTKDGPMPPEQVRQLVPFRADADGFTAENAWWLADAALLSYWERSEAVPIFSRIGLDAELLQSDDPRCDTECYVATDAACAFAIVAFRGTEPNSGRDVWSDLDFPKTEWRPGENVHEGFKQALDAVWDKVTSHLSGFPGTTWFTGHSLGAAVATLAADRFRETGGRSGGVYTFGAPRLGDAAFVAAFNRNHVSRSFRYVNNHDVVTHVPPSDFAFRHVDAERHFDSDGRLSQAKAADGASVVKVTPHHFRGLTILNATSLVPPGILDHMPRAYSTFAWNAFVASR
jgi:triacylglycerol lipase